MNASDETSGRSTLSTQSRRRFIQTTGIGGLGLTAGTSIVTSQDDKDADEGASSETEEEEDGERQPRQRKLLSDRGSDEDGFGNAVAIDGETAIVGASREGDRASITGAAYVFTLDDDDEWSMQARLHADDPEAYTRFGSTVALDGDTALVGGAENVVYVFTRSGEEWSRQTTLSADIEDRDSFGYALALDDDTAIVGNVDGSVYSEGEGSAFVFTRSDDTWTEQARLRNVERPGRDGFGRSVALDGDTALVGASNASDTINSAGAVEVFTRDGETWSQTATLVADDGEAHDWFGHSIDLDGETVVVGAPGVDDTANDEGAAYVFSATGDAWSQEAKLLADDGQDRDWFGRAVAVDSDRVLVGAEYHDETAVQAGAAYVFSTSDGTWSQEVKLLPFEGTAAGFFGSAVDIDGDRPLLGAPYDSENGRYAGAAYVFDLSVWEVPKPREIEEPEPVEPTEIDSCTVIDEPGEYELVSDIGSAEGDREACIVIEVLGVTLRGNGHTIDGTGYESCIKVTHERPEDEEEVNPVIEDVVVRGAETGIASRLSGYRAHYTDITAVDNGRGISFYVGGATLTNCVIEDNDVGIYLDGDEVGWGAGGSVSLEHCTIAGNDDIGIRTGPVSNVVASRTRIVRNGVGVRNHHFGGSTFDHCHICRNPAGGIDSWSTPADDDPDEGEPAFRGNVTAVNNYWGAASGPSSLGDPEEPYVDPETGRPADGDGDAISEGIDAGVSNVRFDPFLEATLDDVGADR